jgi:hypothetical protein
VARGAAARWRHDRAQPARWRRRNRQVGPMCQRVDREKAPRMEGVNQRRKRIFANTPMPRVGRAAWAGKVGFGLREERGQWGRLGRRPSGPVRVAGPKVKKKDF